LENNINFMTIAPLPQFHCGSRNIRR